MIPRFAVVGHPNKGKSSIVSTLAEDSDVAISAMPGTTETARVFPMRLDDEVLYELIDTPGFQRPREVLGWLERHSEGAHDRADTVTRFVTEHRDDKRFYDECELLQPLVEGAGILYVVDGSRPYGAEYEAEMQILRWTGRPRMALINLIGSGDHVDEWQRALDQYFSIVRIFDAVHADIAKRFALLRSFGELHQPWQPGIERAVAALEADYRRRRHLSAQAITDLIVKALTSRLSERIAEDADPRPIIAKLEDRLRSDLRNEERDSRRQIESIYRHQNIEHRDVEPELIGHDLFSSESARLFGLSRLQLAAAGAVSGAVAGGSIDILVGGASLLAGSGIGALIGGASALFGAERIGRLKLLGQSLMSRDITVGPFRDLNLPWVLLGRALLHHRLIAERNHARREALVIEAESTRHWADGIPDDTRKRLNTGFTSTRRDGYDAAHSELVALIEDVLEDETAQA